LRVCIYLPVAKIGYMALTIGCDINGVSTWIQKK